MKKGFNPIERGEYLRKSLIYPWTSRFMLADISGSLEEKDAKASRSARIVNNFFRTKLYLKPGEEDYFRGEPAGIAAKKLRIGAAACNNVFTTQINGCNLDCWYCYADRRNLDANIEYGNYFSAEEILLHFLAASKISENSEKPDDKLNILRLSGGEVFLVPEIIYHVIKTINEIGLKNKIYLWVDCNLATGDFFWKYLKKSQLEKIKNFKNLGICVCYKGFDEKSFEENTGASGEFFGEQFKMHRHLLEEGFDVYSYIYPVSVFPINSYGDIPYKISEFVKRFQKEVSYYGALRMAMPLINVYNANKNFISAEKEKVLAEQKTIQRIWNDILANHYPPHYFYSAAHCVSGPNFPLLLTK